MAVIGAATKKTLKKEVCHVLSMGKTLHFSSLLPNVRTTNFSAGMAIKVLSFRINLIAII